MTSIGASSQVDYLIESVFYPNRKIKEGFHSTVVETKDGYILEAEMPGVGKEGLEVLLEDNELTIIGHRRAGFVMARETGQHFRLFQPVFV